MGDAYSRHDLSNLIQMDGCEAPPWERQSTSELRASKLLYAAVLYSLCIHTLVIFSMASLAVVPSPAEIKPLVFYTAYLTDPEPAITATTDTVANTGGEPILPKFQENENRDTPPPVNQQPVTAPAVVPPPPLSARKLVADRRKVQPVSERKREHDAVAPLSRQNDTELRPGEVATAAAPQSHPATAPEVAKPSGESVGRPAKNLDIQQFLAANIDDIGGKVMALLQYPAIAKRMKWQGLSSIGFVLHPSGEVTDLKVERSSGHEILDKQALAAVKAAAPFDGAPEEVSVVLPVRFHLD